MRRSVTALVALSFALPLAVACGSRTGIFEELVEPVDGAPDEGVADVVTPEEPPPDAPFDVTLPPDAGPDVLGEDGGRDVREEPDGAPPIDGSFPDVNPCPDGGSTFVYLVTQGGELLSFYPPTLTFTRIGTLFCAGEPTTEFSMAVDRKGTAFVLFSSGHLYAVDTATAKCKATPFIPNQDGFATFGMGYANGADGGETLFVDQEVSGGSANPSKGLATVDTRTGILSFIAPFSPPIPGIEMSGTADGRLFGYSALATGGSHIVEIDQRTAAVIGETHLQAGSLNDAWAFAFWGGNFWVFTSPGSTTTVTEYDPATGVESNVASLAGAVVGAGVSTCAPQ